MAEIIIPSNNWPEALAKAIGNWQSGDIIIVKSENMRSLAHSAAERMGKEIVCKVRQS